MELVKQEPKTLLSKSVLINNIKEVIENRAIDMKLQRKLTEKFMDKKLDNSTVYALFRKDMSIEQIEDDSNRLICLTEGLYENLDNKEEFNIGKYFSDNEIFAYKMFKPKHEEPITVLNIKNATRINKYEYSFYMPLSYASKLRQSGLPKYNADIQRPLKIKLDSSGNIIYSMNLNKEGIHDLYNRFQNKDEKGNLFKDESKELVTTNIYFFIILEDGKEPMFTWDGDLESGSIGNIRFKPDFNFKSDNYAPFIIADGMHRYTAGCDAYDKMESEGKHLDKGFMVTLVLASKDRAQVFIDDTFKRTDLSRDEYERISKTPVNDAVDTLVSKCSVLKNNTSPDFNHYKVLKTITYKTLLNKALKETNIDFSSEYKTDRKMTNIGKIITDIFEYYKEENIKDSLLYSGGIFAGYIAMANELLDSNNNKIDLGLLSELCDKIIELNNKGILNDYNLDKSNVKVKEVFKLFESITMEVCKNGKIEE